MLLHMTRMLLHMTRGRLQKRFDARLTLNVTGELRAELEVAAKLAGEELSATARRILIAWSSARVLARGGPAKEAA